MRRFLTRIFALLTEYFYRDEGDIRDYKSRRLRKLCQWTSAIPFIPLKNPKNTLPTGRVSAFCPHDSSLLTSGREQVEDRELIGVDIVHELARIEALGLFK